MTRGRSRFSLKLPHKSNWRQGSASSLEGQPGLGQPMKLNLATEVSGKPDEVFPWRDNPDKAMLWQKGVKKGEILVETPEKIGTTFIEEMEEGRNSLVMHGVITGYVKNQMITFQLKQNSQACGLLFNHRGRWQVSDFGRIEYSLEISNEYNESCLGAQDERKYFETNGIGIRGIEETSCTRKGRERVCENLNPKVPEGIGGCVTYIPANLQGPRRPSGIPQFFQRK